MEIEIKTFDHLIKEDLYEILKARAQVFVVEQDCAYQDIDGLDQQNLHLMVMEDQQLAACLRIILTDQDHDRFKLGRVLTLLRGKGFGEVMMKEALTYLQTTFTKGHVHLEAQTYAAGFYEKLGFTVVSEEFLEDGIPHVKIERPL